MIRLITLAALLCLAAQTHAQQSDYGDMTDAQVKAIQMTSLATLAGSHTISKLGARARRSRPSSPLPYPRNGTRSTFSLIGRSSRMP
jgi:hypothetical protein